MRQERKEKGNYALGWAVLELLNCTQNDGMRSERQILCFIYLEKGKPFSTIDEKRIALF